MQTIKMDFQSQSTPPVVPVMQSDSQSRFIGLTLYDGGVPYSAPSGAVYTVEYQGQGANNTGSYNTILLPSGTRKAVVVSSSSPNVVTLELAEQALRVNGEVKISLCVLTNTGYKLNTFPIICRVTGAPYVDPVSVRSFFYVTGLTSDQWTAYVTACQDAQKRAEDAAAKLVVDPTLKLEGRAADAKATGDSVGEIKEDLDSKTIILKSVNEANPDEYSDGFLNANKIQNLNQAYSHTGYIKCKKGDIIRTLRCAEIDAYHIVQYYDHNNKYVTNSHTDAVENEITEFTVPNKSQIAYCVVNFRYEKTDIFMVTVNADYPSDFVPFYRIEYLNDILEKTIKGTILFSGDSICYGAGYSGGYPAIIKKRNPLANVVNYGVSGTTIAKRSGRSDSILERVDSMQDSADFVILEGGVNDAWTPEIELGTFSKNGNVATSTTFDESTFSGALETLFHKVYQKYPSAHIMFVIVSVSDNYNTYEYLNRAKEICEKWRVTPIDIRESGLNLMIKECVSLYGANGTDGTHPSKLGYEKFFVPMIETEIKKYL